MNEYSWDFSFLSNHYSMLIYGIAGTLLLSCLVTMFGFTLGALIGVARTSKRQFIRIPASCYVEIFRNTPPLVQLLWLFYALPILTGMQPQPLVAAAIAFSIYTSAFMAEVYRGGIQSIERGQWEAGRAIGFTYIQQMRYIILPQAIKRMIPAATNQFIETVKLTSLASIIAYKELVYYVGYISDLEYRSLESYTILTLIFTLILIPLSYVSLAFEKRLRVRD
ncbi:amino acid ABC transporter permease [Phyllobacterium sp. YR531]|uniref:amino acid ABC transporter permease n=1 Tax=Phyllobacterium sp. YR531 TaxID=1144343 RepID=UPI00026FB1C9|nr:amino acid ABC transporter permease [Phyllobacterium sp. YR531]EJN06726.1 amine acid ABC transporter, permease protein, 3-TM region, His/Glu/Gln/Arg/opine family [Phyllobacterium sp. YR531]